ncbi:uncharacterized protein LOC115309328, partial [Ixodes scapularis]|uniref:uncharacterized protein LOC115309328 n=1 Tax=Ixodes scapularis TaxID=6945 RepID=UPI001A9D8F63
MTFNPQIVMGTESWLDDTVSDTEVFPPGFTVYRKDRHRHGGGVFLLVSSWWRSCAVKFENDSESVWCRVRFPKGNTVVFGTIYRPPDGNETSISLLSDMSSVIPDTVFLGGDFNLPDFSWLSGTTARSKSRVYSMFTELIDTFGLIQYVMEPTRLTAVLDLVLCNDPKIVSSAQVYPGISDHDVVVTELNVSGVPEQKQEPRRVLLYEKGNFDAINNALQTYSNFFMFI